MTEKSMQQARAWQSNRFNEFVALQIYNASTKVIHPSPMHDE
jgi:hypothetical protein